MGNISWTKSWSSSDDGSPFSGSDIQNIQNNITAVVNGNIDTTNLAATLTFSDGDYIDLSATLHNDSALQGLRLPQIGGSPTAPTSGEGQIGWDQTNNTLEAYNGTLWDPINLTVKLGSFTKDTSTATNTAVTGVGFTPRMVLFLAATGTVGETSIGIDDGTANQSALIDLHAVTADSWNVGSYAGLSIALIESATARIEGEITTLDTDGFTIAWTRTADGAAPTGTATIKYAAFR